MDRAATYREQLLDPRWQRRRLEVLERDGWRCVCCRAETRQLHAHHIAYLKGLAPWEYDERWLISLCDRCHAAEHRFGDAVWAQLRVEAVQAGAVAAGGHELMQAALGRIMRAAAEHGWEAVADVAARVENLVADAAADRLDLQRGSGRAEARAAALPVNPTIRAWMLDYQAEEVRA